MARTGQLIELLHVQLDARHQTPLGRQLEQQVRQMIVEGKLKAGTRLPSSRQIADRLSCSRGTVVCALDQLTAEGFLVCRERQGTFVAKTLSDSLSAQNEKDSKEIQPARSISLSKYGEWLLNVPKQIIKPGQAFSGGTPDVDLFPFDIWSRMMRKVWCNPPLAAIYNQDPAGYIPLRKAIANYIQDSRGVICNHEEVVITAGIQQALDLTARLLLDAESKVWVEEPGFLEARIATHAVRARIIPVPVDSEGIQVSIGVQKAPNARMAIVSPSHQYPLGMIMSYARRLELLDWANKKGAWIFEDDYDSEFRHSGAPLPALRALNKGSNVLYAGTFAKTLFSTLRLGYLVLPSHLVERFCRARYNIDPFTSMALQPVLARFIEDGHFATYMHKMRRQFRDRREALIYHGQKHMSGLLEFVGDKAGMHVVGQFLPSTTSASDKVVAEHAKATGVIVNPLSDFYMGTVKKNGLLLGFGSVNEKQIKEGIEKLTRVMSSK